MCCQSFVTVAGGCSNIKMRCRYLLAAPQAVHKKPSRATRREAKGLSLKMHSARALGGMGWPTA